MPIFHYIYDSISVKINTLAINFRCIDLQSDIQLKEISDHQLLDSLKPLTKGRNSLLYNHVLFMSPLLGSTVCTFLNNCFQE